MTPNTLRTTEYFDTTLPSCSRLLSRSLSDLILDCWYQQPEPVPLVFLCIGSDRVTGDSLGPLVGYKLKQSTLPFSYIYGTLEQPVHALNLDETMVKINAAHPQAYVIAIDACLGSPSQLGYIALGREPLQPGAGVHKDLPAVGDISLTGVVNITGGREYLLLQTTRLATVMEIADRIVEGITGAFSLISEFSRASALSQ